MMEFLRTIQTSIESLEKKDFYRYLGIFLGFFVLLIAVTIFQYSRTISKYKKQISYVNSMRDEVRTILSKHEQIERQRKEVDEILSEEEDFNIVGYIESVITKLGLGANFKERTPSSIDREDNYREDMVKVALVDMNMKQLTELLNEIENNPRIFTTELEIIKSKKTPTIEVNVTIATLHPKTEVAS